MEDYVARREEAIKQGKGYIAKVKEEVDHPLQTVYCLTRLIRYNKSIQSIILNNCGLNA